MESGAFVVDARPAAEYAARHVPGTVNIPLNSSFTTWAGWLAPYDQDIYLIEACAMVAVFVAVMTQTLADIGYTYLNPRIRFS